MSFELHPRLAADCEHICDFDLCTVLLMRDDRFPWAILVPRIEGLRDYHDLPRDSASTLFDEIAQVSNALVGEFGAHKINVAALGNQVPQLHIHVIGRYKGDAAWPGPVWNAGAANNKDGRVTELRAIRLRYALRP